VFYAQFRGKIREVLEKKISKIKNYSFPPVG
jgi:hypothetical protein